MAAPDPWSQVARGIGEVEIFEVIGVLELKMYFRFCYAVSQAACGRYIGLTAQRLLD